MIIVQVLRKNVDILIHSRILWHIEPIKSRDKKIHKKIPLSILKPSALI